MAFEKLRQGIKGQVFEDEETLRELHRDFGRLVDRMPAGAVVPASTEDVAKAVRIAFEEGWSITTRGVSHSQGGQSLSSGGLLLDMSVLNRIERMGHYSAWVEAGCLWSDLVREAAEAQLAPPGTDHEPGRNRWGQHLNRRSGRFQFQVRYPGRQCRGTGGGNRRRPLCSLFPSGEFGVVRLRPLRTRSVLDHHAGQNPPASRSPPGPDIPARLRQRQ